MQVTIKITNRNINAVGMSGQTEAAVERVVNNYNRQVDTSGRNLAHLRATDIDELVDFAHASGSVVTIRYAGDC